MQAAITTETDQRWTTQHWHDSKSGTDGATCFM